MSLTVPRSSSMFLPLRCSNPSSVRCIHTATIPTPGTLRSRVWAVAQKFEANRTRKARDALWNRFIHFAKYRGIPPTEMATMMFVMQGQLKASTRLRYLADLKARMSPRNLYDKFRLGLRRLAANQPLKQAPPATWDQVLLLISKLGPREAAAVHLAWRTASRMQEIEDLRYNQIFWSTIVQDELVIDWGAHTKTSALQPHQPQLLVHLPPSLRDPMQWSRTCLVLRSIAKAPWFSRPNVNKALRALKLGDHSLKAGAISEAINLASSGFFPVSTVALLAKHAQTAPPLPASTVRYARNRFTLAAAIGTGAVTAHL